jgi:hypothetical protein
MGSDNNTLKRSTEWGGIRDKGLHAISSQALRKRILAHEFQEQRGVHQEIYPRQSAARNAVQMGNFFRIHL